MKLNKLITLALFIALSFSITHEFAFAIFDEDHCSTSEYVSEMEKPSAHDDICDIHYKFHQASYLPTPNVLLPKVETSYLELTLIDKSYYFNNPRELYKPPIS